MTKIVKESLNEDWNKPWQFHEDPLSKDEIVKSITQQINAAGARGQDSVILTFQADDFSQGYDAITAVEDKIKVQERGMASYKSGDGTYNFNVKCVIIDESIINTSAKKSVSKSALRMAIAQIREAQRDRKDYAIISFNAPTHDDGWDIVKKMEDYGAYCVERGFNYERDNHGYYSFDVKCAIGV